MKRTILATIAVSALAGAFVIPSLALGNARRTVGSLTPLQLAETPFIVQLSGANAVPPAVRDPNYVGTATVSFDVFNDVDAQVCFDARYTSPEISAGFVDGFRAAHIHRGAVGAVGPVVVDFGQIAGLVGYSWCVGTTAELATEIASNPAGFYMDLETLNRGDGAMRGQLTKGAEPAGAQHILPTPLRAYDSRVAPATRLAAGETRTVSLANGKDNTDAIFVAVPPGATAAIVTITATDTAGPGFIKVYDAESPEPATSNVNFTAVGATVAVSTPVAVDGASSIKVTAGPSSTHVVIDVIGYLY